MFFATTDDSHEIFTTFPKIFQAITFIIFFFMRLAIASAQVDFKLENTSESFD